jgi:hypothetical protein
MRNVAYLMMGLAILASLAGCIAAPALPPLTSEQVQWFTNRDRQPPSFTVASERSDEVWSRAKLWLANYSDFKLQTVDSEILETYYPPGEAAARFGYQVTRQKVDNGQVRVNVKCVTGNAYAGGSAYKMSQALSLYASTGVDCPGCGGGVRGRPNAL